MESPNNETVTRCTKFTFSLSTSWISKESFSKSSRDLNIVEEVLGLNDSPVAKNDEMHDLLALS